MFKLLLLTDKETIALSEFTTPNEIIKIYNEFMESGRYSNEDDLLVIGDDDEEYSIKDITELCDYQEICID